MSFTRQLIAFDGDDTLWISERLYDEARAAAAKVVERVGIDPMAWSRLQRQIDVQNVNLPTHAPMGLSSRRFPTSSRQAYERLCIRLRQQPDDEIAQEIYSVSCSVFDAKAPLMPSAKLVLEELSRYATLVLLTQGDEDVQRKRIKDSGLAAFFDECCIVDRKTVDVFAKIALRQNFQPNSCWSIGNSLASDINTALRAGWNAVWIKAHVWEHERRETVPISDNVIILNNLHDVLATFGILEKPRTNLTIEGKRRGHKMVSDW